MDRERQNIRSGIYDALQAAVSALVVCVLLFTFFVRLVDVDGSSMHPTLEDGDRMAVSDLFYAPAEGDIVVIRTAAFGGAPLVKRVIATGGQTVDIDFDTGVVWVDGRALDEPYVAEPTRERLDFTGPVTVPADCVFVMGDNRNASNDSRDARVGCVDEREIIGRVLCTLFPFRDGAALRQ